MKSYEVKRITALILTVSLAASLTGCFKNNNSYDGDGEISSADSDYQQVESKDNPETIEQAQPKESDSDEKAKQSAEKIVVDVEKIKLKVGESKNIKAEAVPTKEKILWSSSDDKVASVDNTGKVTALSEGKCTITVQSEADKSIKAYISVVITPKEGVSSNTSSKSSSSSALTSSAGASSASQSLTSPNQSVNHETSPSVNSQSAPTPTPTSQPENSTNSKSESKPVQKPKVNELFLTFDSTTLNVGQTVTPFLTVSPNDVDNYDVILNTSDSNVVCINENGSVTAVSEGECTITAISVSNEKATASVKLTVKAVENTDTDNKSEIEQDSNGLYFIDGILIVNKSYSLPSDYNPGGLTQECSQAFDRLRQGAAADGINIWLSSGFRSYDYQYQLYNGYVYYYGQYAADTFSARAGHSEHQTGLAIDCNIINDSFIGTPEAIWLEEHCYEYGFIIRYPRGKQDITGYKYEPWHIRYIGEKAEEITKSGLTLEEYFGITSSYE